MATADLITQLKQDFDDVYEAGKTAGGGSGDYEQGYEDGKNSVVDYLQYVTLLNGVRRDLISEKDITLNLLNATTINNLFNTSSATVDATNYNVEHITVNCPNTLLQVGGMFFANPADTVLKRVTLNFDTSNATSAVNFFRGCQALEVIDGTPLDFSSVTTASGLNMFNQCSALKEVRFAENSIKYNFVVSYFSDLSADTIQSIIDGLVDLTGGTAQTLTLHATVGGKLTDEQKATITAKNWELVY